MMEIFVPFENQDFVSNPYPYYREWRKQSPIFYDPERGIWFFLNFTDINYLLRDRRLGRVIDPTPDNLLAREFNKPENWAVKMYHQDILMDKEPPAHTRLKGLVQQVFTPRRVEALRGRIRSMAEDLLAEIGDSPGFDFLSSYAEPLPVMVISELLGVPKTDWRKLRSWSNRIVKVYELDVLPGVIQDASAAVEEFYSYLRWLNNEKKKAPSNDLLDSLVELQTDGSQLSEPELLATCVLLLNAGHEATVNVFGNGMLALLQHPQQLAWVRSDPQNVKGAIEEILRFDTPLQYFHRWVLEEFEYEGIQFKRGEKLGFLYGAGNRDPQRFEAPDQFDPQRQNNAHLTFGGGLHYCLGAPLARLELQEALQVFLSRYPFVRLQSAAVEYRPTFVIRGLKELLLQVN